MNLSFVFLGFVTSLWLMLPNLPTSRPRQSNGSDQVIDSHSTEGMKPFVLDHRNGHESVADVSFLLDTPAGKDGFVQVRRSHFVKPNGERMRFWGVHLTDWSPGSILLPPKEDAPMWAATLARHGINMVRLHFLDLDSPRGLIDSSRADTQSFDAAQLDRFDFMVAELKKRGIYMDLNLNVGRSYKPGDNVQDAVRLGWAKGVVYYDPRLIELQKDYATKLLSHRNPYTGAEYRNEPAIAIVELVNENALYMGFRAPTPYYERELLSLYNTWLSKNLSADKLNAIRKEAGVGASDPIPRLQGPAIGKASVERYSSELSFYMETEKAFYRDMKVFLRNLGVKQPIIGTADHSHSGSSYAMLSDLTQMDAIDGHDYWQHPGSKVMGAPMVNDPLHSTVVELSRTAVKGKPYTVSETNHPFPNDYSSEGIPIIAAYGCLQDWDMIIMYTFEPKLSPTWKPYVTDSFDISHDPVRMNEMATGALTFLRGDVRAAKQSIDRTYSKDQVVASGRLPASEAPYFTPGFPLALPLIHRVRIKSFDGPSTTSYPAVSQNPIVSDTGQLSWTSSNSNGLVTVNSDRTQSIIGFVTDNRVQLKNLSVDVTNRFASIVVCSMDAKPISNSTSLLMITGSKVANTGMVWNPNNRGLSEQGHSPTLVEPVSGKIILRNLRGASSVTAYPLDGSGKPIGNGLFGTKTSDGWALQIGDPTTTWYKIDVHH